ncbi:hypothetical protein EMPS_01292 [Entomortierella parvispora]|uniref:Yeast cell wall synthesis Kre9/Knh1-like N-terminal domain-containing protein n=1 Tax=Entomortierella parvispora TaxID=205924 RepID=A0A9P3H2J7_9FUNG|nr:hypothetical protein EMPS_01292 [Entomortierella parvispora]
MHSSSFFLVLATLLAIASTAMADLQLTAPNSTSFVTAGGSLQIAWTYSGATPASPPTISVELVDNNKKLFTGPLALFSNLATTSGMATWSVPKLGFVGGNFSVILVANIASQATIYAIGPSFAIQPEGTAADQQPGSGSAHANGTSTATISTAQWRHMGKGMVLLSVIVLVITSF